MQAHGLQGVTRGRKKTTIADPARPCLDDKVNRQFIAGAADQLRVSDFTCVSTWTGMVHVALIINVLAGKIVGWRVSTSMTTAFVLEALNQAICQRCPVEGSGLLHHSDCGGQYRSIRHTERLPDAGIDTSVGSVGDSCKNALAESIVSLFKTGVINFLGARKSILGPNGKRYKQEIRRPSGPAQARFPPAADLFGNPGSFAQLTDGQARVLRVAQHSPNHDSMKADPVEAAYFDLRASVHDG